MVEPTPALRRFAEIVADHHQYARDWRQRTRGKVLGYLSQYVPEEIIAAAGMLPVRVIGNGQYPEEADGCMGPAWCAFSRDCLAQALRGKYDYLDGLVYADGCYHMMQVYDSWIRHAPIAFSHFLDTPWHVRAAGARECFVREAADFRDALGQFIGHPIGNDAIDHAIAIFNANRRLMSALYQSRKSRKPSIMGTEVLYVVLANMLMDKGEHSILLSQLLGELEGRVIPVPDVRLMVVGEELVETDLMALVESLGALVVADECAIGSRYFNTEVPAGDDPLQRIADRCVNRIPSPLLDWAEARSRVTHLLHLAKDYQVDGVVFLSQKFCDPQDWDTPIVQRALDGAGIPNIALEMTIPNPIGPLRTRLEAFVETLTHELV